MGEMEVVYASLIQNAVGQKPTKSGVQNILNVIGAKVDESQIDSFFEKLGDRELNVAISEGLEKMTVCQAAAAPVVQVEEKQAEQKEEAPKPVEEDVDVFDALF